MRKYITIRNNEVSLAFIAMFCVVLFLSSALAAIYYTKTINHQATIITNGKIQAYQDAECTQVLDNCNWGNFNASSADHIKSFDFYLKSESNVEVNVTWATSTFTSYNATEIEYETPSWKLYLVKVEASEVKLRPENDTTPDKGHLSPGEVAHLKFYLTAIKDSPPDDFAFQTSFNSRDD
jgi:uncharacterized protein (DUF2164 family)